MKKPKKIKLPAGFTGVLKNNNTVIELVADENHVTIKPQDISCFDDVLLINGVDKAKFEKKLKGLKKDERAYRKAKQITKACNPKGWIPDFENGKSDKYIHWWKMGSPSGVGFALGGVGNRNSGSSCGSRLVFADRGLAEKMANLFLEEVYKPLNAYSSKPKKQ